MENKKTNSVKIFFAAIGAWINRKKIAKAKAEAEAKAKQQIEKKFLTQTKDLAQEFTNMNKAFKKQYPTNYIKKMEPYFKVQAKARSVFNHLNRE